MTTYSIAVKFVLSFMLVSTALLTDLASASTHDCAPGYGCNYPFKATDEELMYHSRKILMGWMGSPKAGAADQEKAKYGVQMRNVPSGPDPLHHNNGPQRRPRISP